MQRGQGLIGVFSSSLSLPLAAWLRSGGCGDAFGALLCGVVVAAVSTGTLSTQMTNIEQHHDVVKESFFHFIRKHIPKADLSIVDEIVLSYVISILEEASQDPCFDVEGKGERREEDRLQTPLTNNFPRSNGY